MNLRRILKHGAPILLCALSSAGVIATGVASAKATEKCINESDGDWRCYIPTAGIALGTIACICGSYVLGKRQQAALLAGQMAIASSYSRYKEAIWNTYGEEEALRIEEDAAVYAMNCFGKTTLDIPDPQKKILFKEMMGGTIFESTLSKVVQAEYHLNRNFVLGGEVPLSMFYDFLGLHYDEECKDIVWCIDDEFYWIDFDHKMGVLDTGEPVCFISCTYDPATI